MAGGADLILQENRSLHAGGPQRPISTQVLTKAWRPPSKRRQWSVQCTTVHCIGDTNTCGNRFGLGSLGCEVSAAQNITSELLESGFAKM